MMRLGSKGLMGLASAGMLSALNRPSYAEGSSKYGQISPARMAAGQKAVSALDAAKTQEITTRKAVDLAVKRSQDPSIFTTIGSKNLAYWNSGKKECSDLTKKCADARGALESKEHRIGAKELTKLHTDLEDLEEKSEALTKASSAVVKNTRVVALGTVAVVATGLVAAGVYSGVFAKMYAGLGTSAAGTATLKSDEVVIDPVKAVAVELAEEREILLMGSEETAGKAVAAELADKVKMAEAAAKKPASLEDKLDELATLLKKVKKMNRGNFDSLNSSSSNKGPAIPAPAAPTLRSVQALDTRTVEVVEGISVYESNTGGAIYDMFAGSEAGQDSVAQTAQNDDQSSWVDAYLQVFESKENPASAINAVADISSQEGLSIEILED